MPKLESSIYRTSDSDVLANFYGENFGFEKLAEGSLLRSRRDPGQATALELHKTSGPGNLKQNQTYWKIGLCMPDVNAQVDHLNDNGVSVCRGSQFREIGFLTHLADPDGNSIELLQHHFERNFPGRASNSNLISVGQITIRSSDIEATVEFYEKKLGMKMLSIQPVDDCGFCLYFLGYTDESPPVPNDLRAIKNREWLWQRTFCTIEIQHKASGVVRPYEDLSSCDLGWLGMRVGMSVEEAQRLGVEKSGILRDPNNIPVFVKIAS